MSHSHQFSSPDRKHWAVAIVNGDWSGDCDVRWGTREINDFGQTTGEKVTGEVTLPGWVARALFARAAANTLSCEVERILDEFDIH